MEQLNQTKAKKRTKIEKNIKAITEKYFLTLIDKLIEASRLATPPGKSITRNQITVMDQPDQILFPTTEIGGSVSTTNTLWSDTANRTDPTI